MPQRWPENLMNIVPAQDCPYLLQMFWRKPDDFFVIQVGAL
jgi:hypothetical protein